MYYNILRVNHVIQILDVEPELLPTPARNSTRQLVVNILRISKPKLGVKRIPNSIFPSGRPTASLLCFAWQAHSIVDICFDEVYSF